MHVWPVRDVVSFPQQQPGSIECGVFLMKGIEHIAYDNKITFTNEDMQKNRGEIAAAILKEAKTVTDDAQEHRFPKCEEGECLIDNSE